LLCYIGSFEGTHIDTDKLPFIITVVKKIIWQ